MKKGWLDKYGKEDNANDSKVSLPEGFVGMGNSTQGRNYSPAWGGQFYSGGKISVAQRGSVIPSNAKDFGDFTGTSKWTLGDIEKANAALSLASTAASMSGVLAPVAIPVRLGSGALGTGIDLVQAIDERNKGNNLAGAYNTASGILTGATAVNFPGYWDEALGIVGAGLDFADLGSVTDYLKKEKAGVTTTAPKYKTSPSNTSPQLYSGGSIPSEGKYAKKTMPSAQNGKEMQFYQHGLDWKPNNISQDGSITSNSSNPWQQGMNEYQTAVNHNKFVDKEKIRKYAERNAAIEEQRIRENAPDDYISPIAQQLQEQRQYQQESSDIYTDPQTGKQVIQNIGIQPSASPIDAGVALVAAGAVGGARMIGQLAEFANPLPINPFKNAYKLNPNLKNPMGFKNMGDTPHWWKGYTKEVSPETIDLTSGFPNYRKLITKNDDEVLRSYNKNEISWDETNSNMANYVEELNKNTPFGDKLGQGSYGSVYTFKNHPNKVIKLGQPYGNKWSQELIDDVQDLRKTGNISLPERLEYFEIPSQYKNYSPVKYEVSIMDNLNNTNFNKLDLSPRDRYALLLKQTRQLRDKGIALDVDTHLNNLHFNRDKGVFDMYDVNPGSFSPSHYMHFVKDRTKHLGPGYYMYKDGGVIADDRGQWAHPGEITRIGSNQITMKGVPYPVKGISNTGDVKMMYPEQDYQFKGTSVTEYPMARNGINNLDEKTVEHLDQLTNFTNYNKPSKNWLDKYSNS